jgi:hypothetical protein
MKRLFTNLFLIIFCAPMLAMGPPVGFCNEVRFIIQTLQNLAKSPVYRYCIMHKPKDLLWLKHQKFCQVRNELEFLNTSLIHAEYLIFNPDFCLSGNQIDSHTICQQWYKKLPEQRNELMNLCQHVKNSNNCKCEGHCDQ